METTATQSREGEVELKGSFSSTSCTMLHAEVMLLLDKFYITVHHYFHAGQDGVN